MLDVSEQAIKHVLPIALPRSADKHVLTMMANFADKDGITFPSVAALESATCLDRKTIIAAVGRLLDGSRLLDTGERKGTTGRVRVYQIVGMGHLNCPKPPPETVPKTGLLNGPVFGMVPNLDGPESGTVGPLNPPEIGTIEAGNDPKNGTRNLLTIEDREESLVDRGMRRKRRSAPKTPPPENFWPDTTGIAYAQRLGVPIEIEVPRFLNHHGANGKVMANWQQAWRVWCDNFLKFGGRPINGHRHEQQPPSKMAHLVRMAGIAPRDAEPPGFDFDGVAEPVP